MSAYCTIEDFSREFDQRSLVELTNESGNASSVNEDLLTGLIASCSDFMDGYLRGRYGLPLQFTSDILTKICLTLVKYELHSRRKSTVNETIQRQYDSAVARMKDIQRGTLVIGDDTVQNPTQRHYGSNYRKPAFDTDRW